MPLVAPTPQPFVQRLFLQQTEPYRTWQYPSTLRPYVPPVDGVVVTSDAELTAAVAAALAGEEAVTILVNYSHVNVANIVNGKDFTGKQLYIRSYNESEGNWATIENSEQGFNNTKNVKIEYFNLTKDLETDFADGWFIHDTSGPANDIILRYLTLVGPAKDADDPVPSATWGDGLPSVIRFTHYLSYNITIEHIKASWCRRVMEIRPNGTLFINQILSNYVYFDNLRLFSHGDEGYVEGLRLIMNWDQINDVGAYEEIDEGAPHKDQIQVADTGGANNTNTKIKNLIIWRNRCNPNTRRGSLGQALLAQAPLENVIVHESFLITKGAPHGFYLEGGGKNVALQDSTMASSTFSSAVRGRNYKMYGEVVYHNVICMSPIHTTDIAPNDNDPGYELRTVNSHFPNTGTAAEKHAAKFTGPANQNNISGLISMLTPLVDDGQGPIDGNGEWRGNSHMPLMPVSPPNVTGGAGQFTIDVDGLFEPIGNVPGNNTTYTHNLRWCVANSYDWTVETGVSELQVITGVDNGSIWVQTQCHNGLPGFWSDTQTITVT